MRANTALPIATAGGQEMHRTLPRAGNFLRANADRGERRRQERRNTAEQFSTPRTAKSRSGTDGRFSQRWDAGFVAQLIGQVLASGDRESAAGYEMAAPAPGTLLNTQA
jgi:hypothetical protein